MSKHLVSARMEKAHAAYAVLLVFALTQGPVLSWWIRRPDNPLAPKDLAIWCSYLVVVLPALIFLQPIRDRLVASSSIVLYLVVAGWMCLSFLWSTVPQVTAPAAVALLLTTLAGIYLALQFDTTALLQIIVWAMLPGLLLSEWANHRHWQYSLDAVPHWTGIYLNRNSLGPPAVMAIFSGVTWVFNSLMHLRSRLEWVKLVGAGLAIGLGLHLQLHGGSRTSWVFLAISILVATLWISIIYALPDRFHPAATYALSATLLVSIAITILAIYIGNNPISSRLELASDFSGRRIYWRYSWSLAREHLFVGQGWMSPWFDPVSRLRLPPELAAETYSHSSILDILSGGGLIGLGLATLAFGVSIMRIARRTMPLILQGWSLGVCAGLLIASSQESFLIGYHFFFLLFVAVACSQPTSDLVLPFRRTNRTKDEVNYGPDDPGTSQTNCSSFR